MGFFFNLNNWVHVAFLEKISTLNTRTWGHLVIPNTLEFRLDGTKINGENEASC